VNATSGASCSFVLPDFSTAVTAPSCYGPNLDYVGHLDFTVGPDEAGQLPGGDLGIWSETEASGEACAAAKMNGDINAISAKVDSALFLVASISCLFNTDSSLSLPNEGDTTDITSTLATTLASDNPSITLTSATLSREADIDANPNYLYSITFTSGSTTANIFLRYNPTNSDGTTYKGKLWASYDGGIPVPGGADSFAFSLLFEKSASDLNYKMLSMNYADASVADPFDASKDVDVTSSWLKNFTQTIASLTPSTGLGAFSYAWQAGNGDSHARIFNFYSSAASGSTLGYGFFGYGDDFDEGSGTLSDNTIDTFICNWAGPANDHTGLTGKAQKQVMELNAGGIFVPTNSFISYAPVNDCDMSIGEQNGGGNDFKYKLVSEGSYPATQPAVTNDLVLLSSDSDYANYSAPTAPTDF
jgi:hypothetical protein